MLKPYSELRKIDVTPYCDYREAKDDKGNSIKVPYLNWAKCVDLLHNNGAEVVYFEPCTAPNGSSLFMSEECFEDKNAKVNRCYEVRVRIVIDDKEFYMQTPVMNGANVVRNDTMNQLRVANAQARAFVKGVAIYTGLGFGLWSEYEKEDDDADAYVRFDALMKLKEQAQQLYTSKLRMMTTQEICSKLGVSFDTVKAYFSYFDILKKFVEDIQKI